MLLVVCEAVEEIPIDGEEALQQGIGRRGAGAVWYESNTYIGPIVETAVDGYVEELGEMPDGEAAISCARGRCTALDFFKDICSIWLRYQGSTMAVVPHPFLRESVRETEVDQKQDRW